MPSPGWKRVLLEGDAAVLSDTTPLAVDGTAAGPGTGITASRYDHRHALGPLVANLDFAEKEGTALALQNSTTLPALVTTKPGRIGFYTYDSHPYVYSPGA